MLPLALTIGGIVLVIFGAAFASRRRADGPAPMQESTGDEYVDQVLEAALPVASSVVAILAGVVLVLVGAGIRLLA